MLLSLFSPVQAAFADDTLPPADSSEVVDAPQEGETVPEGETPAVEEPVTEAPAAVEVAPTEEVSVESEAAILSQLPENTEVVVLDEAGETVPLVTQEAANIIQDFDPLWCPEGDPLTSSNCRVSGSIAALLTDMRNNTSAYDHNGVIYFTANSGGSLLLTDSNSQSLGTTDFNDLKPNNLTLQGGWNGSTVTPQISGQTAFGNGSITIGTSGNPWMGNITLKDFTFSGVSSSNAITIYTSTGNIALDNVDVSNQTNNTYTALLNSTSGNITVQNGSSFDGSTGNQSRGLSATTGGSGSITISDTSFQQSRGNGGTNYNGATLTAQDITLTNVISQSNDGNGIFVNGNASTIVTVSGGSFINNGGYGLRLNGGGTLYVGTAPTCTGNAPSCYNVTPVSAVLGCTDPTAFNYNPLANIDDGSCVPVVLGCTDPTAFNYNPLANTNDGSCVAVVQGCTDPTAFNYNPLANTDDGSCVAVVQGCTDPTAFNYNPAANTDDGSCVAVVQGCTDPTAFNYNPAANTDDGSCVAVVQGCTDPTAFNYNSLANTDDGSCGQVVLGCTDQTAFNYNSLANTDDGSCVQVVLGCTDQTAFNYNSLANTDDGSCVPVVIACPFGLTLVGNVCVDATTGGGGSVVSTNSTTQFIPTTGKQPFELSCNLLPTMFQMAGFEVTFPGLCGYSALLDEVLEGNLIAPVPAGNAFVGGIKITLLQNGAPISVLPTGASITLSFELPAGMTGENLVLLYWDPTTNGGAGGWVEKSVSVENGQVVAMVDMPGTFILVDKSTATAQENNLSSLLVNFFKDVLQAFSTAFN
jgi:hypothetical protein